MYKPYVKEYVPNTKTICRSRGYENKTDSMAGSSQAWRSPSRQGRDVGLRSSAHCEAISRPSAPEQGQIAALAPGRGLDLDSRGAGGALLGLHFATHERIWALHMVDHQRLSCQLSNSLPCFRQIPLSHDLSGA